jgi:hypothetical protein
MNIQANSACRSQWSRGLEHVLSSAAPTLGSWVRIPFGIWIHFWVLLWLCCPEILRTVDFPLRDNMGWYGMDWSGSGCGPLEISCEHGNKPSGSINAGKFLSSCTLGGFSGRAQFHEVSLVTVLPEIYWQDSNTSKWEATNHIGVSCYTIILLLIIIIINKQTPGL